MSKAKSELIDGIWKSKEEWYTSWYLDELKQAGIVGNWKYEPTTYNLTLPASFEYLDDSIRKPNKKVKSLLRACTYTPDFYVPWNPLFKSKFLKVLGDVSISELTNPFFAQIYPEKYNSQWDTKGGYKRANGHETFTAKQAMLYQRHCVYCQEFVPKKIFEETFTPKRYLWTDGGKQVRKIDFKIVTLEEYLK